MPQFVTHKQLRLSAWESVRIRLLNVHHMIWSIAWVILMSRINLFDSQTFKSRQEVWVIGIHWTMEGVSMSNHYSEWEPTCGCRKLLKVSIYRQQNEEGTSLCFVRERVSGLCGRGFSSQKTETKIARVSQKAKITWNGYFGHFALGNSRSYCLW